MKTDRDRLSRSRKGAVAPTYVRARRHPGDARATLRATHAQRPRPFHDLPATHHAILETNHNIHAFCLEDLYQRRDARFDVFTIPLISRDHLLEPERDLRVGYPHCSFAIGHLFPIGDPAQRENAHDYYRAREARWRA